MLASLGIRWGVADFRDVTDATVTAPLVRVELVDSPQDEADPNPFVFRVRRNGNDAVALIAVRLATRGTMTPGLDFVAPPRWVMLPAGVASVDVAVPLIDDAEAEGNETIELVVEAVVPRAGPDATGGAR